MRPSVESILNQTYKNTEIILIDDGSTDSSGAICDEFADRDDRVRVIHKPNGGVGYARNSGIEAAVGEYVYFFDGDDIAEPDLIEDNFKAAKSAGADIEVFGYKTVWLKNSGERGESVTLPPLSGAYDRQGFWDNFPLDNKVAYAVTWRMFRREFLIKNNLRFTDMTNGEDGRFMLEAYAAPFEKIVYNNKKYYYNYIRRGGTATTRYSSDRAEDEYTVSRQFDRLLSEEKMAKGRYGPLIKKHYVMGMCMTAGNIAKTKLPLREKEKLLREYASRDKVAESLREVPLSMFTVRSVRLKVLFFKLGLYKTGLALNELKIMRNLRRG